MTDPNALESRIARMQESDYQHHRAMRHAAKAMQRDTDEYRARLAAFAEAAEEEETSG